MDTVKYKLDVCLEIIQMYKKILNSYVLDFYVEDHWSDLPSSWRALDTVDILKFSEILRESSEPSLNVWPLSILALRKLSKFAGIPNTRKFKKNCLAKNIDARLTKEMLRKVKPKKLHEIEVMSKICAKTALETQVTNIIDFGSGLGHLSRNLSFCHALNVCCIECQTKLTEGATKLDENLERRFPRNSKTLHINNRLNSQSDLKEIIKIAQKSFKSDHFGLIGLHPCGDLSTLLIKNFLSNPDIRFINIVGCCYMKLTIGESYPLSEHLKTDPNSHLSYEMLELACHANEKFAKRLENNDYCFLKVHSYRAALEEIIVKHRKDLKHSGLRSIQHSSSLSFEAYCSKALRNHDFKVPQSDVESEKTKQNLGNWKRIVIFYSLRLLMAPFVESAILLDRVLHLMENGCKVSIFPAFDAEISPRCHITRAIKPHCFRVE